MMWLVFFVLGLAVGSFLNVCIYRLPRKISVVRPPSHCPKCQAQLEPWDNIPLVSFIVLGGRCRRCGSPIHWRYPLVEFLGGLLFVACYLKFGVSFELFLYYAFSCAMVVVAFIDLEFQIIPDEINLPFLLLGLVGSFFTQPGWVSSLVGVLVGGGSLVLTALIYVKATGREGMGAGDFKLVAMMGAFLGWKGILLVIFLASLAGALTGVALMLAFRMSRKTAIPFGSFLAPAGVFVLFFGQAIIEQYVSSSWPGR
ncbi:MAG: prepilin peptidase [Candidatus Eisenbacteria bacterium]|nr:prepilin peptidase [Candidatus Eisenbacteria bacterium]